jgi:hypothetical protein
MQLSGNIISISSKTLGDVRDSILTYHIMVGYCSYFTLWGLGICATYYMKEVQGSVLYITPTVIYVIEEVWEYWMEIDITILYSNTSGEGTLPKTIHGSDQFSRD